MLKANNVVRVRKGALRGMVGVVIEVNESGDARVEFEGVKDGKPYEEKKWIKAACLEVKRGE